MWSFDGSVIACNETGVHAELVTLLRWILQRSKSPSTESRANELNNSCIMMSDPIDRACKTARQVTLTPKSEESTFHTMIENPYAVGLSLYMCHNFRNHKAAISYKWVIKICNKIVTTVCENIKQYGVYVSPGLLKNRRIRVYIDTKLDTSDGKQSFHGTALAEYQRSGNG